jgi:lysozyme
MKDVPACLVALSLAACGSAPPEVPALSGTYYGEAMGMNGAQSIQPDLQSNDRSSAATVVCAGAARVSGIDVSVYQGSVNWPAVRAAGKHFAYIRYSDGTGFVDPNFGSNWRNARAAGLTVGAYQFFRASENPTTQADLVVNAVSSLGGLGHPNLPIAIDVETNDGMSSATVISHLDTWLARVQSRTGRRRPVLYSSPGFWNGLGSPFSNPLPYLWDAHWFASCPSLPSPWGRLRFWQYADNGPVSGISGAVDTDLYNGSLTEMQGL